MLFSDSNLFLTGQERRPWNPKAKRPRNLRIPQLRLFATELAFLNMALSRCDRDRCVVVYAGASEGSHLEVLASLYPRLPFHLYDPRDCLARPSAQTTVYKQYFNDKTAHFWRRSGKTVLFISDIRSTGKTGLAYEIGIGLDMVTQARWVEIMKPAWWSLKFRIPYHIVEQGKPYPYLSGWLMLQPFAKPLSMELKLIGTEVHARAGAKAATYDTRLLEELLYHHNSVVRPSRTLFTNIYSRDATDYVEPGFQRSYDVTYLLYVIEAYLGAPPSLPSVREIIERISKGEWTLIDAKNAIRSKTHSL